MSGADRMRALRRRRSEGRIVLPVEVDGVDLEAALTEARLLDCMSEPTRTDLADALTTLLSRILSKRDA
jgi:hypothetical protein